MPQIKTDDLKAAGAALVALVGLAVPISVATGALLLWERLHHANVSPVEVLPRVGTEQLATEGAQVLTPVVFSLVFAYALTLLVFLISRATSKSVDVTPLLLAGVAFLGLAIFAERNKWQATGGIVPEVRLRIAEAIPFAVGGVGLVLAGLLLMAAPLLNSWQAYAAAGALYLIVATVLACVYLSVLDVGPVSIEGTSEVAVLISNPRPEQKGMPRRRIEGRIVYSTSDAVGVVQHCPLANGEERRIVEVPRKRVIWIRTLLATDPRRVCT
jgi:hypothetical protein